MPTEMPHEDDAVAARCLRGDPRVHTIARRHGPGDGDRQQRAQHFCRGHLVAAARLLCPHLDRRLGDSDAHGAEQQRVHVAGRLDHHARGVAQRARWFCTGAHPAVRRRRPLRIAQWRPDGRHRSRRLQRWLSFWMRRSHQRHIVVGQLRHRRDTEPVQRRVGACRSARRFDHGTGAHSGRRPDGLHHGIGSERGQRLLHDHRGHTVSRNIDRAQDHRFGSRLLRADRLFAARGDHAR